MRINHNISALKANNQLLKTNKYLDSSLQKLSSGKRINSAADDSAGLAISEKMRTQISGLEQSSRNAADGISVIQTAEGALQEVEVMLQRARELSVQASNGTNTNSDRTAIQTEINQLKEEINRISRTTEFNTKTLLDGTIDRKSFSSNNKVNLVSLSDTVEVGNYTIKITQDARQAVIVGAAIPDYGSTYTSATRKISSTEAGTININGESVKIVEGDSINDVFEKIRSTCDTIGINVTSITGSAAPATSPTSANKDFAGYTSQQINETNQLLFVSKKYGSSQKIDMYCDNSNLSTLLGLSTSKVSAEGINAVSSVVLPTSSTDTSSQFNNTATVSVDGNKVTVTDKNDFKVIFEVDPGTVGTTFDDLVIGGGTPNAPTVGSASAIVSVLDAGPMDLQIGANEGQSMSVRIPKVNSETLGIDDINVGTADGAEAAISILDEAISMVSSIRSKLGAYQNRLEHSISNLDTSSENMTESLSRIEDVDMAAEMAEYTQKNVLAQAGTSMLAQANQRPQTILSLLRE